MQRDLARGVTFVLLMAFLAVVSGAHAQVKPKGGGPAQVGDEDEAVTAGQMTEDAAQAKRLFDAERWSEAALQLKRVADGETGDDQGNRQIAQYHLAIALYRLQFYQASYDIFRRIADRPRHLKFKETLLWLAKLATQLPEPANIIDQVGKYGAAQLERFNNPEQQKLYWQLSYLLGRYQYTVAGGRRFKEAIALFEKVGRDSPYYVKAQFFMGISYVQLRKSVPAVQAFRRILDALDEGVEGVEDEARMRDLAHLSLARTFYSAATRLDPETGAPRIDAERLSAAVKYWNLVDQASEYWLDALFEQSWAYFMAGDFPRALGNIHTIQSPYFPNAFYPEADIVRMVIYFTICQYEDATTLVARFEQKYVPIRQELVAVLKRLQGEGWEQRSYQFLLDVRDGQANLSQTVQPIVENALSDRALLRHIEYVRVLEAEIKRFEAAPAAFRESQVGLDVYDNVAIAKQAAIRRTGQLTRRRFKRNLDELHEHLRNGQKILVDITQALREDLDQKIETDRWTPQDAEVFGVVPPDDEHVRWPFDGEYWRDELGTYRQVVVSRCGTGRPAK